MYLKQKLFVILTYFMAHNAGVLEDLGSVVVQFQVIHKNVKNFKGMDRWEAVQLDCEHLDQTINGSDNIGDLRFVVYHAHGRNYHKNLIIII